MSKKAFQGRKGMNPALAAMSQQQRNNVMISSAYKANMLLSLTVLHDKFGFGRKRLEKFIDESWKLMDAYNAGYVSVSDIEETLAEETGITVKLLRE